MQIRAIPNRRRVAAFAAGAGLLLVLVGIAGNAEPITTSGSTRAPVREIVAIERDLLPSGEGSGDEQQSVRRIEPITLPVWVVRGLGAIFVAGTLYLLSRQRFTWRRPSIQLAKRTVVISEEEQADVIATFARDLIDDLKDGDSPRYAIQRAYAAVETGFGHPDLARKPAETPLGYLARIFGRQVAVREPLERLTELFQLARFSEEPIDESMRAGAIDALVQIRDHYTAQAWNRIERRERAEAARAAS